MTIKNNISGESVYQMAIEYLEYCGNDISTSSYARWSTYEHIEKHLNDADKHRVFLCAIAIQMDAK